MAGNTEKEVDDILVFRSSISETDITNLKRLFAQYPQIHTWSIDLEDWEKVLRIESEGITVTNIIDALRTVGIIASELE